MTDFIRSFVSRLTAEDVPFAWRTLCAVVLAAALALVIFSWPVMSGGPSPVDFPKGDQAATLAGAFYFYRDEWRLPLLDAHVPGLAQSVNIAFTDSLPLLALPLKAWFKLTGQMVNFTAGWLWICMLGQAIGTLLLLEQLQLRRMPELLAGVLIAVTMPSFLFRYWMWHLALCGQFALIFGLALYFRYDRADRFSTALFAWSMLLIATLLIHPYLFAMQFAQFLAYAARKSAASRMGMRSTLMLIAGVAILVGTAMLACGYFSGGVTRPISGFGAYSMNLLAPFGSAGKSGLLPDTGKFAGATNEQVEGFNYLGLGLMGGVVLALAALAGPNGGGLRAALIRQRPLAILSVALCIYAVSNRVYFDGYRVLSYPVPEFLSGIVGTFRSSGRFFWPVGYVVIAGVLTGIARGYTPRVAAVLLVAIASVQWLDTAQLRRMALTEKPASLVASNPVWQRLVVDHRSIALYPPTGCVVDDDANEANAALQFLAARAGRATNSITSARGAADCDRYRHSLLGADLPPDTLVVLNPPYDLTFVHDKGWSQFCHAYDERLFCTRGRINVEALRRISLGQDALAASGSSAAWAEPTRAHLTVQALYLGFLHRPADPDGLKFWTIETARSGGRLRSLATRFAGVPEAYETARKEPNIQERIAESYAFLAGRAPRPEEFERLSRFGNWPASHQLLPWLVIADLLDSKDARFLNRLEFAQHYTESAFPKLGWRADVWAKAVQLITDEPQSVQQAAAALHD